MRRFFLFAAIMGIMTGMYYLYQKQLGAIPFLLLSIYFFVLAYSQLLKKTNQNDREEKANDNDKYS
ncbi:hypothetical protein BGM26_19040 [Bacillus sp. FJAT-29790]|uniref:hypothetical protein n=1 Tax=Bacillus sp. FJAT-29790 TaxID=1895002 RepID=UPI001C21789B|nr:hypothetical protein [Bacillus sp. FJAT-29790]MBU8881020.1 hypothetical protein [Bacillus sp. FJAT-29790]